MTNANGLHILTQVIRMNDKRQILQNSGLKSTEARMALLSLLEKEDDPKDVESIVLSLKTSNVKADQATVYRILEILTQKGLINRVEFGEGKYRYELQKDDHHHLVCSNCGSITDVEDKYMEKIEDEIKYKTGFLVKSHSLEFFGLCQNCQS